MPIKPAIQNLSATSPEILNAIRNNASENYRNLIPTAQNTTDSIRAIGDIMMQYQPLQNEFLSALVNRIGRVIITSKMYENPWAGLKKGLMEFGETVEEIFVNIAKPFQFDPALAETNVFKREIPDVRAAFHTMNYQKYYKSTIQNDQLRQAFLSWEGITDLIGRIVDAMYTGANYDEFQTMKYMLARHILNGRLYPQSIPTVNEANMKQIVTGVKNVSNQLTFLSTLYNQAGVATFTNKDDQYIIISSEFDAAMDVEVLASAFNMSKAEFIGRRILIDGFGALDTNRLAELFKDDPTYVPITDAEKTALNQIPMVSIDRDYFMIFDNFYNFTELYNGEGLYWNYWYHVWKTFSVSPFANAVMYVPGTPTITAVTVSPATASVNKGQSVQFAANVTTTNMAPKTVDWKINSNLSSIDTTGKLIVGAGETATSITVTATSTYDSTKTGTATVTIV